LRVGKKTVPRRKKKMSPGIFGRGEKDSGKENGWDAKLAADP